jgi:hypothetical protein
MINWSLFSAIEMSVCANQTPSIWPKNWFKVLLKFWKFCILDEQVLRAVQPICDEDVVLGQYEGYKDDPTVPKDSSTPTFASIILRIKNERWDGRMPELTL